MTTQAIKADYGTKKRRDESWDFRTANTKEYTHVFHRYPAQMIPQIARRLINEYGIKDQLLYDPYCGSGTSLVEALIYGMDSIGSDINPLAVTISKAKTAKIPLSKLQKKIGEAEDYFLPLNRERAERKLRPTIPDVVNIDYWFPASSVESLGRIRTFLDRIEEKPVRDFFVVAFSETVREASYTRSGEFKLFRIPKEKIKGYSPDVYKTFLDKVWRNIKGYKAFLEMRKDNKARVLELDVTVKSPVGPGECQIVVTSPPYGDSHTTVAYGQFSVLPLEWLDFPLARQIDNRAMGGNNRNGEHLPISKTLDYVMEELVRRDPKRAKEVGNFYSDLDRSIGKVGETVKDGGYACYVVGNRTVKSYNLPTDDIICDLFREKGFKHVETIIRSIPNKAMPSVNSPTNKPGLLEKTMTEEYIVILRKT